MHTHPAHPTLTRTRLPANPHESPPPPRHTKSSLANLFIANHSPWKLQIFNFIWHRNRWEASGSQRDKTNLGKEERREFALGPSSAQDLATSGALLGAGQVGAWSTVFGHGARDPGRHRGGCSVPSGSQRHASAPCLGLPRGPGLTGREKRAEGRKKHVVEKAFIALSLLE